MIKRKKPLRRTPLKRESRSHAKARRIYMRKRAAFLAVHPLCQVTLREERIVESEILGSLNGLRNFRSAGKISNSTVIPFSCDIHHTHGRTGSNYLDEATWMAVCREAHDRIHENPRWARAKGYLR